MRANYRLFTLEELCTLVDMNKRKIRYYIQQGLVDKPQGTGKGAHYSHQHLEQLLAIRKWKAAGLSLEKIRELIFDSCQDQSHDLSTLLPRRKKTGDIEVWSHIHIQDGVELHIEPQRCGLTPEQVQALCREITRQLEKKRAGRMIDA